MADGPLDRFISGLDQSQIANYSSASRFITKNGTAATAGRYGICDDERVILLLAAYSGV